MNHTSFTFSTKDGLSLLGRAWLSTTEKPKGMVHLVHGLGEHSGRYAHVAETMNEAGYHFAGFDLRGHGLSEGKKGYTPDFDHLLDDIQVSLTETTSRFGQSLPTFLYGHSLGANLVINYALRRNPDMAGIIATAPSLRLAFKPPKAKLLMGKLMAKIMPGFTMSSALDINALSRDKAVVKAYQDDVYIHDRVSAKLAMDIIESGQYALDHAQEWELPLLLMHGTGDRITSHQASQEFANNTSGAVDLVLWKNYYHEIHDDFGSDAVLEKMVAWLDEKTRPVNIVHS